MKLGIISDVEFVLHDPQGGDWDLHNFAISPQSLGFSELPDSAFSTPARYIAEIFLRLCSLDEAGRETPKLVFNPLYAANKLCILLLIAKLRTLRPTDGVLVLTDEGGRPVAYVLPAWLKASDSRFLTLLSAIHGEMDAQLLRLAFFSPAACIVVEHLGLGRVGRNGFLYEENRSVYEWVTQRAIEMLTNRVTSQTPSEAMRQRNAIPLTALMPYHAGDLLFFSIAFNSTRSEVSRIVVNRAYLDIVQDNAPSLSTLPIDLPPANRDEGSQQGSALADYAYFQRFCNELPKDSFYAYFRASRHYNTTKYHLIDHFAFALGAGLSSRTELSAHKRPGPQLFLPERISGPRKVLLHFDGGWPLKIYPRASQEELIDLLSAEGFAITVLASTRYEHPKCEVTIFTGYEPFVEMLRTHHLLVGMDSFPAHYAAHVLGLPTICLFANTQPENSDARPAPHYRALEKGLRCRPCSGVAQCPLYGGAHCRNFVDPQTVATEVMQMLRVAGNHQGPPGEYSATLSQIPERPTASLRRRREQHVHVRFVRLKVALASAVLPVPRYLAQLYREFSSSVRKEGILLAAVRTQRYLRRVFRRQA
jgi:hypothetical protein